MSAQRKSGEGTAALLPGLQTARVSVLSVSDPVDCSDPPRGAGTGGWPRQQGAGNRRKQADARPHWCHRTQRDVYVTGAHARDRRDVRPGQMAQWGSRRGGAWRSEIARPEATAEGRGYRGRRGMARPPQPEAGAGRRGHAGVSECEGRRGFIPTPACPSWEGNVLCQLSELCTPV